MEKINYKINYHLIPLKRYVGQSGGLHLILLLLLIMLGKYIFTQTERQKMLESAVTITMVDTPFKPMPTPKVEPEKKVEPVVQEAKKPEKVSLPKDVVEKTLKEKSEKVFDPKKGIAKLAEPIKGPTNKTTTAVDKVKPGPGPKAPGAAGPGKGQVATGTGDVYQAPELNGTVDQMVGRSKKSNFNNRLGNTFGDGNTIVKGAKDIPGGGGGNGKGLGGDSAALESSKNTSQSGNIYGLATGSVNSKQGVEGIVKKGNYVIGIPTTTIVVGSIDPDVIRRLLEEHLSQFRSCYQKELDRGKKEINGLVQLDFTIGTSGYVQEASTSRTTLPEDVSSCVVNVLKGIKFPQPKGGGKVLVKQPMNFYPQR